MVLGLVAPEASDPPSLTVATSSLIAVLGLVAINGFFVAAEFALVAARRSKLDEMIARGDRRAKTVQAALQHLDRYRSEERRVGKECRSRWWADDEQKSTEK